MKKILSGFALVILVWGCAKKIAPSNSGTASSGGNQTMPAETNIGNRAEGVNAGTVQAPIENSGTFGTKDASAKTPTAEEAAAVTGQGIFNAKCGTCHGLKPTTDFTADRWASILAVMAPRAKLSFEEKESVYAYVKLNAKK